jgi:PAS domain S-box-containing protein
MTTRGVEPFGLANGDSMSREQLLERQMAELQRFAHIGRWIWNIADDQVTWDDELYRIYGLEPGSVEGSFHSYLERVHPDDRERVRQRLSEILGTGDSFEFDERIVRPTGEVRVLRSRGVVDRDAEGGPTRLVGTCQDVTELFEATQRESALAREQKLRLAAEEQERRAGFLADATILLASSLDYQETLRRLAELAVERIADWCAIDIRDLNGAIDRVVVAHPDPAKAQLARELHEKYPPDPDARTGVPEVLRSGRPELVPEIPGELLESLAVDEEHLRLLRELRLRSYMIVPLRSRNEIIGAITLVSAESGVQYDEDDLRFTQDLADRAALSVDNARLYGEAERATSEVRRILESITDAFFAVDREWRFTYVNSEAEQLLGRPASELLGRPLWETSPSDDAFAERYREAMESGRAVRFEALYVPAASWFDVKVFPSVAGLSIYLRDIAEERDARESVRTSELRYRSLVDATAAIVWNTPDTGEFGGEQPSWSAFTGQTVEQYRGTGWLEAVHPEDRAATVDAWVAALESRSPYEVEHRLRRADGEYRSTIARAVPIVGDEGEILEWVGIHTDITLLRKAQEALERQNYITRTITENATSALFMMNERGHCTYMNAAAIALTGYSVEEIRGMPLHDAIHHHHPDGRPFPLTECPIDRALPEDFSIRAHEDVFIRKDGSFFPVVCAASPIFDRAGVPVGTVVEVRDVTDERIAAAERERLIQERESERARLLEIFQEAPAFISTLRGPSHVFETANPLYLQLVGHRDVIGKSVLEVLPEVAEQGFIDLLDTVFQTGQPFIGTEVPILLQRTDGADPEQVFVNFTYQPMREADGSVSGIFVHGVDVTDQVVMRREVEAKAEELASLARRLEISNRELDQFAYVASHDLKAPLRGIGNLSQWIEEDLGQAVPDAVREHLDLLRGRVSRMEGLIDGILQYSRAGRTREMPEQVDVGGLLRDVIELIAPPSDLDIEIGTEMPTLVTERLLLEQVFMNLIGNAVKYAGEPGGTIRVETIPVGPFHRFTVRDDGPGIAPEYHDRIFGIFQTLEARDKVEGTGIGLSLVKKIVENRGGRVWLESAPGEGATFHFLWPVDS